MKEDLRSENEVVAGSDSAVESEVMATVPAGLKRSSTIGHKLPVILISSVSLVFLWQYTGESLSTPQELAVALFVALSQVALAVLIYYLRRGWAILAIVGLYYAGTNINSIVQYGWSYFSGLEFAATAAMAAVLLTLKPPKDKQG